MYARIGPYREWWGPYQIANLLQKIGFSEDRCDVIGEYLAKTWLMKFCEWVDNKKKRNIKIKIDNYDIWGMDHTLALIIIPMLKMLKEKKHGTPSTDESDVPEKINDLARLFAKEDEYDSNGYSEERWNWIMNEMIWAFEQIVDEDDENQFYDHSECPKDTKLLFSTEGFSKLKVDREGLEKHHERIKNGLRLFGKYYQSLWD